MAIAGIDIGTTGCKCSVYTDDGDFICEAYREYNIAKNAQSHELDVTIIWEKLKEVLKEIAPEAQSVRAMGVTSFGETTVLLDDRDQPLMPAMLYTDQRGEAECHELIKHFGEERIAQITGVKPHHMFSLSKWMWLAKNRADLYERTKHIFLIGDYIVYLLSGVVQTDYSLASRTMAFDVHALNWSEEILAYAGIDKFLLPHVSPIGTKAGPIKRMIATELGLPEDIMIVSGCHDQIAATVGAGALVSGMAVDGTGTVECITPVFTGIPENEVMYLGSYAVVPHVLPGTYVTYAFSFTGGALLKWYRDELGKMEQLLADESGQSVYDYLNARVSDEPSDLLVLPYFEGAATPYMDSYAKGAIMGLTTQTKSIDIFRALMEGVTFEMKLNMEQLKLAGIHINELRATGGGATSKVWLQMKADILNVPITSLGAAQSGTLGCVMLAGTACGIYDSLESAAVVFVKTVKTYYPRQEYHKAYMKKYQQYVRMYAAMKTIYAS